MSLASLNGWERDGGNASLGEQPATRPSLLHKIRTPHDYDSWCQFVDLYGPCIYQICRRRGLQSADANEVMQEVLLEIFNNIAQFEYDPNRGRFRGWLTSVIHSRLFRFWKKAKRRPTELPVCDSDSLEYRQLLVEETFIQTLFQIAMNQVESSVQPQTWSAFHASWIDQKPADQIAFEMNRSIAWVYVAKSRVLKKLTGVVKELGTDLGWLDENDFQNTKGNCDD